jgi:hypothetical protein
VAEMLQDMKTNPGEYSPESCEQVAKALLNISNEKGRIVGYDIIGNDSFELGRLSLDSFLVHNLGHDISERFGVQLNDYGLLKGTTKMEEIMDYMNDPESSVEPNEWAWVQVKLFE